MEHKKHLPPSTERIIKEEENREWDEKVAEAKGKIDLQEMSDEDVDSAIDAITTTEEDEENN